MSSLSQGPLVPVEAETGGGAGTDEAPHPVEPVPLGHHPLHPGLALLGGGVPVHEEHVGRVDGDHRPREHEHTAKSGEEKKVPVV